MLMETIYIQLLNDAYCDGYAVFNIQKVHTYMCGVYVSAGGCCLGLQGYLFILYVCKYHDCPVISC